MSTALSNQPKIVGNVLTLLAALVAPLALEAQTPPKPRPHAIKVIFTFPPKAERKPVPFELVNGMFVFKAKLNGQGVWAVLDNAMDSSVIDKQFAVDHAIAVGPVASPMLTPSGSVERRVAFDVPLELPGQVSLRAPFSVIDLDFVSRATGRPISMIMGREYFSNLTFVVLPSRKNFQVGLSGTLKLSADVPFATIEDDQARVQADAGGRKVSLLVDLGANSELLLTPAAWNRLGLDKAPQTQSWSAGLDGKFHKVAHANLPRVTIGPFVKNNVSAAQQPHMRHAADGYVGLGFLSQFDFAIDVKGRKLWLLGPVVTSRPSARPAPLPQ